MKKVSNLVIITLAFSLLYGCASVQIYSKNDLKSKTGLKFYNSKPYLLVELKSAKDMTVKTTVIYLPDLANPQYLTVKPGLGSNELKMAFNNGVLNSYGITGSSEIPETINSLAGLITRSSDAIKQFAAPDISGQQSEREGNFILYEIIFTTGGTVLRQVRVEE